MVNSTELFNNQLFALSNPGQNRSIEEAQESIYCFLLDIVKDWSPEGVLQEFKYLFIQHTNSANSEPLQALYDIVLSDNEAEFYCTIKRCCYILLNNWKATKKDKYIQQLIESLFEVDNSKQSSATISRLKNLVQNFVNSKDYEELKIFASKCQSQIHWSDRYTSNLSVPRSNNARKQTEQRHTAQDRAKPLEYRSKLELAMYMSRSSSTNVNKRSKNPTQLGNEVLRLIKIMVAKQEPSSYANIANTFIKQNKQINYQQFKQRLYKYLIYFPGNRDVTDTSKLNLLQKLALLNDNCHEQTLTETLLLRTCNRLIDYLTTENHRVPSQLFISLLS